jgi:hypothetical protein
VQTAHSQACDTGCGRSGVLAYVLSFDMVPACKANSIRRPWQIGLYARGQTPDNIPSYPVEMARLPFLACNFKYFMVNWLRILLS